METHTFKAEIDELMNMIIHNFYSNKDIFLRELISNSSDALNKLKYTSLTNQNLLDENHNFDIRISLDKVNKTITIEDTGIGMGKDDLINNLGTIAKSGTKDFIKRLAENSSNNNLIGQFGVGFYSAFLIADKVSVKTRHAGTDETMLWESSASGSFTIGTLENDSDFLRGTQITLHVKDEEAQYLEDFKVREIIKKHSSYITYPIMLLKMEKVEESTDKPSEESTDKPSEESTEETSKETSDKTSEESGDKPSEESGDKTSEEPSEESSKVPVELVKEPVYKPVWEKINSEPIWSKNSNEISEKEHEEFYKGLTNDWESYQTNKHFRTEGNYEFTGLLYIPKRAPFDLFERKKEKSSIKLYVKKVLISDDCNELYPDWMGFIKGIVDSQDLPLNASRELLQQSKIIKQINKTLVKKTLDMLTDLAEDKEKYSEFYKNFDKNIKLGVHEETQQAIRDKLINLLRFTTSKSEFVSFEEYKSRMKEGQSGIYYITGETLKAVENSPFVDKLKRLEYEVIYMTDAIDEYIIQHIPSFSDIKLINVSKDDLKIDSDDTKESEEKYKTLCEKLQAVLKDQVEKVVISNKIESQPAIITNPMGMSANMERIMKAQALASNNSNPMYNTMLSKRHLEINPNHPVIEKINAKFAESEEISEETTSLINLVFDGALLSGGYQVTDINEYLKNVYKLV
jgi:molecular chaperone HtpG